MNFNCRGIRIGEAGATKSIITQTGLKNPMILLVGTIQTPKFTVDLSIST